MFLDYDGAGCNNQGMLGRSAVNLQFIPLSRSNNQA